MPHHHLHLVITCNTRSTTTPPTSQPPSPSLRLHHQLHASITTVACRHRHHCCCHSRHHHHHMPSAAAGQLQPPPVSRLRRTSPPSSRHPATPLPRPPHQRWLFQPMSPPWRAVGGGSATATAEQPIKHLETSGSCLYFPCMAVMAQPHGMSRGVQPPKTTVVVVAEPTMTTTAAPWYILASLDGMECGYRRTYTW
ncbi:hypothetical protein Tco_0053277 [Tanacetum coccineum]